MTALDLDGIKARAEAATPGPWVNINDSTVEADCGDEDCRWWDVEGYHTHTVHVRGSNAAFIAAARSDIPALVAEVEALRYELGNVRVVLSQYKADRDALSARIEAAPVLLGDLEETQAALFRHVQKLAEEAVLLGSQIRRTRAALSPQEGT